MSAASEEEILELLGDAVVEPSGLDPWAHQAKEFDRHKNTRSRALFWTMRTGKSKAVIDKFCHQFDQDTIQGVVILAPNGIHLNWVINEIPKWTALWPGLGEHAIFGWETPKRADWDVIEARNKFLAHRGPKWFCMNMEAVSHPDAIKMMRYFLKITGRKIALGISEVHHFGHAGTKRTKVARHLAKEAKFVTVESGTAILNSPLRAYSIFKILDDDGLIPDSLRPKAEERRARGLDPLSYEDFVQYFAEIKIDKQLSRSVRRRAIKKIEKYKNLDEMQALMAPFASVVTRDEVEGMPPLLQTERLVVMSEKQRDAYLEMVSRHLVEIGDDFVTAKDAGARVMKLQQILNGYVMDTEANAIVNIDEDAPIYDALIDEVMGTLPGKTLVWCRYREDIRRVCAKLKKRAIRPLEFHGGVPTNKREGVRLAFQNDNRYTTLVGQPGAGGEGRDFSEADAIIFFSSTPNAIHLAQAEERGTLKGGTTTTVVRIKTPGTVDDRNWALADGKMLIADSLSGRGLRDLLRQTNV